MARSHYAHRFIPWAGNETNYVMQKFARAVTGSNNIDCCAWFVMARQWLACK